MRKPKPYSQKHLHKIERYCSKIWHQMQTGNLIGAQKLLFSALKKYPESATIHHLAAQVAHACGSADTAIKHMRNACRISPSTTSYHISLGILLEEHGSTEEAITTFRNAIDSDKKNCENWLEYGNTLFRHGYYQQAREAYQHMADNCPEDAATYNNLGNCDFQLKDITSALTHYKKAIELDDLDPIFHNNIAAAYSELGDYKKTLQHYEVLLERAPDIPEHQYNYTISLIELGLFDKAKTIITSTLNNSSTSNVARSLFLKALAILGNYVPVDNKILELSQQQSTRHPDPTILAGLIKIQARYCDQNQDYEKAFSLHSQANKHLRQLFPFDRDKFNRSLDSITNILDAEFMKHANNSGYQQDTCLQPTFILGMPRSGTTLLQSRLNEITDTAAMGELNRIPLCFKTLENIITNNLGNNDNSKTLKKALDNLAANYLSHIRLLNRNSCRYTIDKLPSNFLYIPLIKALFPNSIIIHSRRNPIDNCLSCYFSYMNESNAYSYNLDDLAYYYSRYQQIMKTWYALLPNQIINIDYEHHIKHPAEIQNLLQSLIAHNKDDHKQDKSQMISTLSAWQARQSIYSSSVGRWHHYEKLLSPLLESLSRYNVLLHANE